MGGSIMSDIHCVDNAADRKTGDYWERQFCTMAASMGKCFTPHQWHNTVAAVALQKVQGRWNKYTLPDITIWEAPGEHHEIKHKNPTYHGEYGLEVYRFEALLNFALVTRQRILYTIHDHDLAGGKEVKDNHLCHWRTAIICVDIGYHNADERPGYSWVKGEKKEVQILYWKTREFYELAALWSE